MYHTLFNILGKLYIPKDDRVTNIAIICKIQKGSLSRHPGSYKEVKEQETDCCAVCPCRDRLKANVEKHNKDAAPPVLGLFERLISL